MHEDCCAPIGSVGFKVYDPYNIREGVIIGIEEPNGFFMLAEGITVEFADGETTCYPTFAKLMDFLIPLDVVELFKADTAAGTETFGRTRLMQDFSEVLLEAVASNDDELGAAAVAALVDKTIELAKAGLV